MRVGIIGLGKIGTSILKGLIRSSETCRISLFDPDQEKLNELCSIEPRMVHVGSIDDHIDLVFVCVRSEHLDDCVHMFASVIARATYNLFTQVTDRIEIIKAKLPSNHGSVIRMIPNANVACNLGHIVTFCNSRSYLPRDLTAALGTLGEVVHAHTEDDLIVKSVAIGCAPALILSGLKSMCDSLESYCGDDDAMSRILIDAVFQTIRHLQIDKKSLSAMREVFLTRNGFAESLLHRIGNEGSFQSASESWLPILVSHYQTIQQ